MNIHAQDNMEYAYNKKIWVRRLMSNSRQIIAIAEEKEGETRKTRLEHNSIAFLLIRYWDRFIE